MIRTILKLYAKKRIAELESKLDEESMRDYESFISLLSVYNIDQSARLKLEALFNKQMEHGFEIGFENGLNDGLKIGAQFVEMVK